MNSAAQLQADITARLLTSAALSTACIIDARPRRELSAMMIAEKITNALAGLETRNGKSGLAITVKFPEFPVKQPGSASPELETLIAINVRENPLLNMDADNGTGITAEDACFLVMRCLHHWRPNAKAVLTLHKDGARPVDIGEDGLAYDVLFSIADQLPPPNNCADVFATIAGNVTLTTAAAGAAIYYTTDGTLPAPDADSATLYTAPISTPASGITLRAAAYLDGKDGSNVFQRTF
jgi:hypothetical protein